MNLFWVIVRFTVDRAEGAKKLPLKHQEQVNFFAIFFVSGHDCNLLEDACCTTLLQRMSQQFFIHFKFMKI